MKHNPVTKINFNRFMKYFWRIRVIKGTSTSPFPPVAGEHVFKLMANLQEAAYANKKTCVFFPNLHTLCWPVGVFPPELIDYAGLFISPKLSHFRFNGPIFGRPVGCPFTFKYLMLHSPPLKVFALWHSWFYLGPVSLPSDFTSRALRSLNTLTCVELHGFRTTVDFWIALSASTSLTSISMDVLDVGEVETATPKTFAFPPFPALKTLDLTLSHNTLPFTIFAKKFFRNKLHTLEAIIVNYRIPQEDVGEILQDIGRIASPSKLEQVKLFIEGQEKVQAQQDPDILPHTILPLLPFHNLRHILLYPNFYVDLDNQAIEMMAHSWPNLVEFDIGWADLWVSRPKVTLEGVVPLVQYCPLLQTINIVVDATVPISTEILEKVENNNWQSPVKMLNVSRSSIHDTEGDTKLVASFLGKLFPKLSDLDWVKYDGTMYGFFSIMWGWGKVEKIMGIASETDSDTGAEEEEDEEEEEEEEEEEVCEYGINEEEEEEREKILALLELA